MAHGSSSLFTTGTGVFDSFWCPNHSPMRSRLFHSPHQWRDDHRRGATPEAYAESPRQHPRELPGSCQSQLRSPVGQQGHGSFWQPRAHSSLPNSSFFKFPKVTHRMMKNWPCPSQKFVRAGEKEESLHVLEARHMLGLLDLQF